jgi:hypothetical protein
MKSRIITFVVCLVVGSVISTGIHSCVRTAEEEQRALLTNAYLRGIHAGMSMQRDANQKKGLIDDDSAKAIFDRHYQENLPPALQLTEPSASNTTFTPAGQPEKKDTTNVPPQFPLRVIQFPAPAGLGLVTESSAARLGVGAPRISLCQCAAVTILQPVPFVVCGRVSDSGTKSDTGFSCAQSCRLELAHCQNNSSSRESANGYAGTLSPVVVDHVSRAAAANRSNLYRKYTRSLNSAACNRVQPESTQLIRDGRERGSIQHANAV